jgi:hypothetical protein
LLTKRSEEMRSQIAAEPNYQRKSAIGAELNRTQQQLAYALQAESEVAPRAATVRGLMARAAGLKD